jgi:hypothetical protein
MGSDIKRGELGLFFLLSLAIACWWLWPIPEGLGTQLIDGRGLGRADFRLLVWVLAWDAHALLTQPWNLFNANTFYPAPYSLAYSEHLLGYAPLFAPTYWLTHNPVLATNVLILLIFALRALSMYVFARLYVPAPAAALAGVFFGFPEVARADVIMFHVHGFFYLPLALFCTARWLDRARWGHAALLACMLFLQATTSAYLGFALAFAYGAALPFLLLDAWGKLDRRRIVGLVGAVGLALLGAALLALPYLWLKDMGLVPEYGDESTPIGILMAPVKVRMYLESGGVGMVGYALAALAVLPRWSGRVPVLLMGIAITIAGIIAGSGPKILLFGEPWWSPYELLMKWVPGLSTIRLPTRLVVVAHLGLSLLAGLGAARIVQRVPRSLAWGLCVAAVAFLFLGQHPRPIKTAAYPVGDQVPPVYRALAAQGDGRALLELPCPSWDGASLRMFMSTSHWLPIVDGYSGYPPISDDYLQDLARPLPDPDALQNLVDAVSLGWIIVHTGQLSPAEAARWDAPLPPGLELVGRYDRDLLLRVQRPPLRDRRALLVSTEQTLEGAPRELIQAPCPGEVLLRRPVANPWPQSDLRVVELTVRNDGTQTWPAAGVIPKRLVRMRVCWERPGEPGCQLLLQPMEHDVAPGAAQRAAIATSPPHLAGDYVLKVELVQVRGQRLESCGATPLRVPVHVQ